ISTLNTSASRGTRTTPPPRPVRAPRKPAMNDPSPTRTVNSRLFKLPPKPVCHSRVGLVFGWLTTRDSLLGSFFEEAAQAAELELLGADEGVCPYVSRAIIPVLSVLRLDSVAPGAMERWGRRYCAVRIPSFGTRPSVRRGDLRRDESRACSACSRCW